MTRAETAPASVRRVLGEDLSAAVEAAGLVPLEAVAISGLPAGAWNRSTFKVVLAGGRTVKIRLSSREARARELVDLVTSLGHSQIPAARLLAPRVSMEEWVEGTPVSDLLPTRARQEAAADPLASLHTSRAIPLPDAARATETERLHDRVAGQVTRLRAVGAIDERERERLIGALGQFRPGNAVVGVTHNDFCPENLVEDAHGTLFAVDSGGMRVGFTEFDLARTWFRWPMEEGSWAAFVRRYGRRSALPDERHAPFWRIAAVAKSAHLRVVKLGLDGSTSLRALRGLLAQIA